MSTIQNSICSFKNFVLRLAQGPFSDSEKSYTRRTPYPILAGPLPLHHRNRRSTKVPSTEDPLNIHGTNYGLPSSGTHGVPSISHTEPCRPPVPDGAILSSRSGLYQARNLGGLAERRGQTPAPLPPYLDQLYPEPSSTAKPPL